MRTTHKTLLRALSLCLALLIALSGCGTAVPGASASASADTAATTASSEAASEKNSDAVPAVESGEPVTLKVTFWGNPEEAKAYEDAAANVSKLTGSRVTVKPQRIPTDYDAKLTTMIAGNDAPDLAMMESATITFPLAEQGKLLNLKDFLDKDPTVNTATLVPNITYWSDPQTLIGIAPGPEMFLLYYNVDMFTDAGIAPPPAKATEAWTWDQFLDAAKKLTIDVNGVRADESGFDPKSIKQFGFSMGMWWGSWGNFIYQNGGDFVSRDGKFALSAKESTDAIQKLADLVNVHHVSPSPLQSKSLPGTTQALQTKKVAMAVDGQWANMDIGNAGFKYDVAALPRINPDKPSVSSVVCGMFSIFASSKHPQEAWEVLKVLIDPKSTMAMNKGGLWMPSLQDYYTDPAKLAEWVEGNANHPSGYKDAALDVMLNHSVTGPTFYVKNFNKIMDIVNPALDKVWLGTQSAAEAMAGIETQAQAQVQGRRD